MTAEERQPTPLVREAMALEAALYPGVSDERFAKTVLGISPAYWSRLRAGKAAGGGRFMRNLLRRWPHLALTLSDGSEAGQDPTAGEAA